MSIVCKNSSNQTIEKLYQWDINYDIYITGIDLSSTPLCHFCNRRSKIAYVVAPEADNGRLKATIPNALLAEPDTIFLYLYYNTTGDTNRTVYVISFPVVPRQRPQNYADIDNYLSIEMIDQAILEYIAEAAERVSDSLVSRVTALESSTDDMSNELTDIRIGYDDTEYESAGDAVRAIGAALAEIDTVHDIHTFASWTDYYDNIDPIYPGDFIIIYNTGKVVVRMMGEDGTVQSMFIADTNGYIKPDTGIPFNDLSEDLQELITGEGGEITVRTNQTYGFNSMSAYETFILEYPDTIKDGDYVWINESTPTTQKYTLYHLYNGTLQIDFIIHNALYINVSLENDELVVDKTLAQIRTALTQNRDLVLITETGVPIELSDISYTGGVASEVQFTTTAFGGEYHILSTYIIDSNGLTVRKQNISLAGIKDIVVDATNDNDTWTFEIAALPDYYNLSTLADDGGDLNLNIQYNVGWVPFRHPLIAINRNAEELIFGGIETAQRTSPFSSDYDPVLAIYTMSYDDPEIGDTVTRTEFDINNANVPGGGGTGGTKTTWYGTCSTATSTAAKTVSLTGYALETGSIVNITFTNAVSANATLNINSTGAKSIYYHGAAINSGIIGAGATALMFYDGTHYCLISTDYTYIKPSTGIPKTDLSQDVQDALDNATQVFEVTFDINSSTPTCDKTFSEISSAFSDGKVVRPLFDYFDGFTSYVDASGAEFYFVDNSNGATTMYVFVVDDSDAVSVSSKNLGDAIAPTTITNTSATPLSLSAQNNTIYKYTASSLTSLTITSVPSNGDFVIKFVSGATATVLTTPSSMHMPDNFTAPETNTRYEINVSDGYALVSSWAVSGS